MLRDEDNLIKDFVLHHIMLGFEHIYMYDDNSKVPVTQYIDKLPNDIQQKVTVTKINFNILDKNELIENDFYDENIFLKCGEYKQRYLQTYFTKIYNDVSEWCYYCDVDEFIYLKNEITIFDIINKYDTYDSIYIPWLIFGSSYYFSQPCGSVIDTFKFHDKNYDHSGKSIVKMSSIKNMPILTPHHINKHNSFIINKFKKPYDANNDIHICHYNIQSMQTYIRRKMRHEIGIKGGAIISVSRLLHNLVAFNHITQCDMTKYSKLLGRYNEQNNDIISKQFPIAYAYNGQIFAAYNKRSNIYFMTTEHISYDDILHIAHKIKFIYESDLLKNIDEIEKFKKLNPVTNFLCHDDVMYMYVNTNPSCVL